MGHSQACPHHKFDDKVTVADTPHAVLGNGLEAQLLAKEFTVDGEGVPCEGTTSQGQDGDTGNQLLKPFKIALEGLGVREKEVSPSDGLSSLRPGQYMVSEAKRQGGRLPANGCNRASGTPSHYQHARP